MAIDDSIEGILKESSPQGDAVKALISVEKRNIKDPDTDVELKTDLSSDEIKIHTMMNVIDSMIQQKDWGKVSVFSDLINKKERKALSKNRGSRQEIVAVARNPDLNMHDAASDTAPLSFIQRMFRPKQTRG